MIPELGQTNLNFSSFIILLGVVQGILLSVTGLVRKSTTGRIKGLIFLFFTCILTEMFLNRTGYMYHVIQLVDFSEPVQFAIPPLIYFGILSLQPEFPHKKWWLHFIPFFLYTLYFIPYYLSPVDFKMESYYSIHHFNDLKSLYDHDFYMKWGKIRMFQMQFFYLQSTVYLIFCFQLLFRYRTAGEKYPVTDKSEINWWSIFTVLFSLLIVLVVGIKVIFIKDLGDHIIAFFITLILYLSTVAELIKPFGTFAGMGPVPVKENRPQYLNSGIKEEKKILIQQMLTEIMEKDKPYRDSLISLTKVAKLIGEPPYIVSQVLNEKVGTSFYDWLAAYRVEEAKRLLADPKSKLFTIEQIAEEVGYNSKSAFNKVFKKFTGKTPSEYKQA